MRILVSHMGLGASPPPLLWHGSKRDILIQLSPVYSTLISLFRGGINSSGRGVFPSASIFMQRIPLNLRCTPVGHLCRSTSTNFSSQGTTLSTFPTTTAKNTTATPFCNTRTTASYTDTYHPLDKSLSENSKRTAFMISPVAVTLSAPGIRMQYTLNKSRPRLERKGRGRP